MNSDRFLLKHALLLVFAACFTSPQLAAEGEGEWEQAAKRLDAEVFPQLLKSTKITVYSLAPYDPNDTRPFLRVAFGKQEQEQLTPRQAELRERAKKAEKFHGHPILGTTTITDLSRCRAFAEELVAAARTFYSPSGELNEEDDCHYPRHGLVISSGQMELEFTICFECGNVYTYGVLEKGGEKAPSLIHHFDPSFAGYLNAILDAAGGVRLREPYGLKYLLPGKRDEWTVTGTQVHPSETKR